LSNFIVTILSVSVVLGIMVLVHEWGHFIVAKAFGVRVEIFSIGFGPRLWGRKSGDTDYRISGLPLGGYVKMAGDNPLEERKGDPDEFLSKPRWQRALIAVAGPAMNIILSIVLIAGIYMHGSKEPAYLDQPMVLAGVLPHTCCGPWRKGIFGYGSSQPVDGRHFWVSRQSPAHRVGHARNACRTKWYSTWG
jgi:regulator of sigma E protease